MITPKKIFLLIFLSFSFSLFAQVEAIDLEYIEEYRGEMVRIITENGSRFQGVLFNVSENRVELVDVDYQIVAILRDAIVEIILITNTGRATSFYEDPIASRLLIMPTAFPMEKGEFHIADQELAILTLKYGITDHWSLWGGISIPGGVVSLRYADEVADKFAFCVGSFVGFSWMGFSGLAIPYTIFSFGDKDNNFNIGLGGVFEFTFEDFSLNSLVLAISAKWPISETTAMITENWIMWGWDINSAELSWQAFPSMIFPSLAFRISGKNSSWDLGAIVPLILGINDDGFYFQGFLGYLIPIPFVSFSYRIN